MMAWRVCTGRGLALRACNSAKPHVRIYHVYVCIVPALLHAGSDVTCDPQAVNHISFSPDGRYIASASFDKKVRRVWHLDGAIYPRTTSHHQPTRHLKHRVLPGAVQVKVWDGRTGRFMSTLVGHVGAVYMVAWSPDSRLLVSASKDSTLKLWDVRASDDDLPLGLQSLHRSVSIFHRTRRCLAHTNVLSIHVCASVGGPSQAAKGKKAKETLPGHFDEVYALDWSPNGAMVASGSKDRTIKVWRS
jgi:ribosome assembly protein 4